MFRLNHNKLRNILRLYQKCTIFYVAIVSKLYKRSKRLQNGNKMVTICCRFVTACDILSTDGKEMLSFMTERKATLKVWGGLKPVPTFNGICVNLSPVVHSGRLLYYCVVYRAVLYYSPYLFV